MSHRPPASSPTPSRTGEIPARHGTDATAKLTEILESLVSIQTRLATTIETLTYEPPLGSFMLSPLIEPDHTTWNEEIIDSDLLNGEEPTDGQ